MNKKAQLTTYIFFIIIIFIVIIITAVIAPFGALFSSEMYHAGEDILLQANQSISSISNATVKAEIQATLSTGMDNTQDNISISTNLYKYAWIIILFIFAFIMFIKTRQDVQGQYGGYI